MLGVSRVATDWRDELSDKWCGSEEGNHPIQKSGGAEKNELLLAAAHQSLGHSYFVVFETISWSMKRNLREES